MNKKFYPNTPTFYLQKEFETRNHRRPNYSLRAFARDLNLSPSSLSEFLQGKIGFSKSRAIEISEILKLTTEDQDHFMDLLDSRFSKSRKEKAKAVSRVKLRLSSENSRLALDQFSLIADWYHLAILEFIDLNPKGFKTQTLAKSLKLRTRIAEEALNRLQRLNLIEKSDGIFKTTSQQTNVGSETPSLAIKRFHSQILKKATTALYEQQVQNREYQSSFFSIRKSDLAEIKAEIQKAHSEILNKYHDPKSADSIYCLANQLFRIDTDPETENIKSDNEDTKSEPLSEN